MSAPEPGHVRTENLGIHKQRNHLPPPHSTATSHPLLHAMQLSYTIDGTAVYKPVVTGNSNPPFARGNGNGVAAVGEGINVNVGFSDGNGGVGSGGNGGGGGGGDQAKKRRGRPRKYDGSAPVPLKSVPPVVGNYLSPHPPQLQQQQQQMPHSQQQQQTPHSQQQQQQGVDGAPASPVKRRGRPPGSSNKKQHQQQQQTAQPQQKQLQQHQLDELGSPGIGFTPHVITVNTGEDVSSKIMSFSHYGPRAICILSANGTIQSVTLRQSSSSGGSVTYEGRFEILSLSGSFLLSENAGGRSRSGGLSVSLAGPDGRVLGGGVAGQLTAASPVQVVVGSFIADGRKELKSPNQSEPSYAPSRLQSVTGPAGGNSPPSRGTLSESSGGPGSPLHQSAAAVNSTPPGMSNLPWK